MMTSPTFWPDSIRALVIAECIVLISQSLAISMLYARARATSAKAQGMSRLAAQQMGLLPNHVLLISLSYLGLAVEATVRTLDRVGTGLTFWSLFNLVFFIIGNAALGVILRFERTRIVETKDTMLYKIDPPSHTVAVHESTHETTTVTTTVEDSDPA